MSKLRHAVIYVKKTLSNFLAPSDDRSFDFIKKLSLNKDYEITIKEKRNLKFHRKFFALLNYAFEQWQPEEQLYKDKPVEKNFDRFRKDIIILAGFYDAVYCINGDVKLSAKSIAFDRMSEDEFSELYSKVINAILRAVLRNYTRNDLECVVNNILAFA